MKYVGLALLMVALSLVGRMLSKRIRERVRTLEKFRLMLRLMQAEIEYVNMPTYEMVKNASERQGMSDLFFVRECLSMLDSGESFDVSWSEAILRTQPPELDNEDVRLMTSFGLSLGTTDRDGLISLCKMYDEMIAQRVQEAQQRVKSHAALYSRLGIICGVAIVIIFI